MVSGCMWHALLLATASSSENGRAAEAIPSLSRQHAARPQPAPLAAPPDDNGATASSPASLPLNIIVSAKRGEVQRVVKWLRKGGAIDALGSVTMRSGQKANLAGNLSLLQLPQATASWRR